MSHPLFFVVTGIEFQYLGTMPIPPTGTVRDPEPVKFTHGIALQRAVRYEDDVVNLFVTLPPNIRRTQRDDRLSPPGRVSHSQSLHFWYTDGTTAEQLQEFADHVFATVRDHEYFGALVLF